MQPPSPRPNWIERYAALALGTAFLSAVASRFGLWSGRPWGAAFATFTAYTAEVNAFMPGWSIPLLAWSATLAETVCGTLLVLAEVRLPRRAASALLLALFGTAMALSQGVKSPLDYSVFSASAAALLLADRLRRRRLASTGD